MFRDVDQSCFRFFIRYQIWISFFSERQIAQMQSPWTESKPKTTKNYRIKNQSLKTLKRKTKKSFGAHKNSDTIHDTYKNGNTFAPAAVLSTMAWRSVLKELIGAKTSPISSNALVTCAGWPSNVCLSRDTQLKFNPAMTPIMLL